MNFFLIIGCLFDSLCIIVSPKISEMESVGFTLQIAIYLSLLGVIGSIMVFYFDRKAKK